MTGVLLRRSLVADDRGQHAERCEQCHPDDQDWNADNHRDPSFRAIAGKDSLSGRFATRRAAHSWKNGHPWNSPMHGFAVAIRSSGSIFFTWNAAQESITTSFKYGQGIVASISVVRPCASLRSDKANQWPRRRPRRAQPPNDLSVEELAGKVAFGAAFSGARLC
jgi:hypothetical protein